ncbi:hypothetical protein H4I96_07011 [Botrytis cinerea]
MANERRRGSNGLYDKVSNEMGLVENGRTGEGITSPQSPVSWSHVDSPLNPQMNTRSSISNYRSEFGMENLDVASQQMNMQIMGSGIHQPFGQFSPPNHPTGNHMSEDARVNSTTSRNHQSTSSSMLPLHSIMDLDEAANSLLVGTSQPSHQLHIQDTGLSEGLPESAGSWTQYNVSSINWLPYDWAPDYQLDDDTVRMIDDGADLNGSSPINVPEESMRRPTYSTNTTIFTPSPQTQAQLHMDNSPNPTISSEGASTSPHSLTTQSTGRYYVDGHGSRLPRIRKAPSETANLCPSISHASVDGLNGRFAFPVDDTNDHSSDCRQLPHEIYSIIQDAFEKTCVVNSPYFTPFQYTRFPSVHKLSRFIAHYFDSFHQTLPFTHLPSFNISTSHWLFLLAMAAVGSHYHGNGNYAKPMHEFLRRAIMSVSNDGDSRCAKVMMIQIKLLNCVGMMYCGSDELSQAAKSYHRDLNDFCCSEWKTLNQIPRTAVSQTSSNDTEQANREWKECVIGAASGMEHPTVLHLHLARVVLLTPFLHILKLAEYLASSQTTPISHLGDPDQEIEDEILQSRSYVKRWATEDQHKARLAIIHAGALFLAPTLALWAYGLFAECKGGVYRSERNGERYSNTRDALEKVDGERRTEREERDEDEEEEEEQFYNPYPSSMQLDRPADDELVQLFVKRGQGMRALVMGVGNLCAGEGKGARRMLGEGRRVLDGLGGLRWGWGEAGGELGEDDGGGGWDRIG